MQFLKSLIRRPLAGGLIAVLVVSAAVGGWLTSSRLYESTAVAVVIPPGGGNPDAMMNPLVRLDNEMAQLAAIVATAIRINGSEVLRSVGSTGDFTVDTTFGDTSRAAQITSQIVVVARGTDSASAQRGAEALVDFGDSALTRMQAGLLAQPGTGAAVLTAVDPQPGTPVGTSPVRRAVSYGLVAAGVGVVLLLLLDALIKPFRKFRSAPTNGRRSHNGRRATMPEIDSAARPMADHRNASVVNEAPTR